MKTILLISTLLLIGCGTNYEPTPLPPCEQEVTVLDARTGKEQKVCIKR